MKAKRPVNLDLRTIKFPIPAIVSILHRISGIALFLFTPLLLWIFARSLASEESFYQLQQAMSGSVIKIVLWAFLASLFYHLLAGVRHLLMDAHIGESLQAGRLSAKITMALAVILTVLAGVWLW